MISIAEKKGLSPNVMTFGVLALGCQELMQAQEFLEGIEVFGYKPNSVIIDTLINTACHKKNFGYLLFMMKYMMENGMRPTTQTIEIVKKFSEEYSKIEKPKTTVR